MVSSFCSFSSPTLNPSSFTETEPTDLRPQEPHMRLCHGLHHKRHADRSQPDPAERHGVGVAAFHQPHRVASSLRMCMPRGQTLFIHTRDLDLYGWMQALVPFSKELKFAVQPGSRINSISLAGTQKGCLQCFHGFVSQCNK